MPIRRLPNASCLLSDRPQHHTGKALCLPGLAPLAPSGRHFCLEEEAQMVRIQDGKVKEIKVWILGGAAQ